MIGVVIPFRLNGTVRDPYDRYLLNGEPARRLERWHTEDDGHFERISWQRADGLFVVITRAEPGAYEDWLHIQFEPPTADAAIDWRAALIAGTALFVGSLAAFWLVPLALNLVLNLLRR